MNALDRMPNFSEELQTNNVLTRRILELKVKKGSNVIETLLQVRQLTVDFN
jgi:hypothetical protein